MVQVKAVEDSRKTKRDTQSLYDPHYESPRVRAFNRRGRSGCKPLRVVHDSWQLRYMTYIAFLKGKSCLNSSISRYNARRTAIRHVTFSDSRLSFTPSQTSLSSQDADCAPGRVVNRLTNMLCNSTKTSIALNYFQEHATQEKAKRYNLAYRTSKHAVPRADHGNELEAARKKSMPIQQARHLRSHGGGGLRGRVPWSRSLWLKERSSKFVRGTYSLKL